MVKALKHPDKTVELILDGLDDGPLNLREPIPPCDARGLHVGIKWSKTEVVLYLNGKARKTLPCSRGAADDPAGTRS